MAILIKFLDAISASLTSQLNKLANTHVKFQRLLATITEERKRRSGESSAATVTRVHPIRDVMQGSLNVKKIEQSVLDMVALKASEPSPIAPAQFCKGNYACLHYTIRF